MSILFLYVLVVLINLKVIFICLSISAFIVSLVIIFFSYDQFFEDDKIEDFRRIMKKGKILLISSVLLGGLVCFIPSWKQIAVIVGVNYLTNNEEAKKLPSNILKYINKKLKDE